MYSIEGLGFFRISFSGAKSRMNVNRKNLDVDTFLTRQLCLKNPDNTDPAANLAVLTDGKGGTYLRNVFGGATIPTGFNALYLPDTNTSTVANNAYNVLSFKAGTGVSIFFDNQKNVVFNTIPIVPSSFSYISTPAGTIYADMVQANFNMVPQYGVNFSVSNNKLLIGGNPSFGTITVTNQSSTNQIVAGPTVSSFAIQAGFGVDISLSTNQTIQIATSQKAYSLNQITIDNLSTFMFGSTFNNLNMTAKGNLRITQQTPSTLNLETHGFSRIVTDTNQILEASTSVESLSLVRGYGLDYAISPSSLTILLASTMARTIQTETVSTIATSSSVFNLRAGSSIQYTNTAEGALKIDTLDFNKITCSEGGVLYSNNIDNSTVNKTMNLVGGGGVSVKGDPLSNTVSFLFTGRLPSTVGTPYSYAQILIYSSIANVMQPVTSPYVLNAAPNYSATLGIAGLSPVVITPSTSPTESSIFYIGVDSQLLLQTPSTNIGHLNSTVTTYSTKLVESSINVSTLTSNNIFNNNLNVSSINVSSITISANAVINNISSNYAAINNMTVSSIINPASLTANPLMSFNYSTNCVGINKKGATLTNNVSLDISGAILANTFATYSDPSLKEFTNPYNLTLSNLDSLNPSHFRWLSDEKEDVGFSANEIETILPSAVSLGPSGLKLVDYSKISIISIAALKDAHNRIKALESTVQILLQAKALTS